MKKRGNSGTAIIKSKKSSSKVAKKLSRKQSKKLSKKNSGSGSSNGEYPTKNRHHPIFHQELTLGQRAADRITEIGGSWPFVIIFGIVFFSWIVINAVFLAKKPFDPYPFILLNLCLSVLAAIQAPIILMAQNRQTQRDRIDAKYDHQINRKAEREIQMIQKDLETIRRYLRLVKNEK